MNSVSKFFQSPESCEDVRAWKYADELKAFFPGEVEAIVQASEAKVDLRIAELAQAVEPCVDIDEKQQAPMQEWLRSLQSY